MKKEKKKSNFRKWIWNGSMAAALAASAAVFLVMLQIEKQALADYEEGTVFVAAREIPRGQLITEENYAEYFKESVLDKSFIPKTAVKECSQIKGLVAENDIEAGVLLTEGMFQALDSVLSGMAEPVIVGLKAEDLYQMVGGVLRTGDRIHIYRVEKESTADADRNRGSADLLWENVFVQGVFDQAGTAVGNEDKVTAVQRINVYLEKADVENFYAELTSGSLRVAKVEK